SHQVVGKERADQPVVCGHGGKDQRRRHRNVQKEAHALLAAHGAQLGGQRNQVIVVHPDDVVGPEQIGKLVRKHLIHASVATDVASIKIGQIESVVEHRPEHAVAVPEVVAVVV